MPRMISTCERCKSDFVQVVSEYMLTRAEDWYTICGGCQAQTSALKHERDARNMHETAKRKYESQKRGMEMALKQGLPRKPPRKEKDQLA